MQSIGDYCYQFAVNILCNSKNNAMELLPALFLESHLIICFLKYIKVREMIKKKEIELKMLKSLKKAQDLSTNNAMQMLLEMDELNIEE